MNKKIIDLINKVSAILLIYIGLSFFKESLVVCTNIEAFMACTNIEAFMVCTNIEEIIDIIKALILFLSGTVIIFATINLLKEESE